MQVPLLQTDRLLLRPISILDLDDLLPFSYFDGKPVTTRDGIIDKLSRIEKEIAAGNSLHWGMALKSSNQVIGAAGFYRGFPGKTGEIGYAQNPAFERQGFMREAVAEIVKYGFAGLNLDHVIAYTSESNPASIKVLLHNDFLETVSDIEVYKKFIISRQPAF
ncbi:GNAT family N-acetyltransferase [Adhaeribacter sp. BT258]|uniref:GNAT family N-acetyltransferase n=1 Tax=Adhaeribacter terrigena TaxID=2793070 RepID=A0ABS1BZJ1_9BACT|nr:GNAT family N-acetyltransferase [Adhaeribacter terrigena]MBK0402473.1 GNAT family N-acetyltransferase [Adhaeribacter terrigena]